MNEARRLSDAFSAETPGRISAAVSAKVTAVTCAEARALDRTALVRYGIPGLLLMENASRAAADLVEAELRGGLPLKPNFSSSEVFIFCGTGNNAGDGLAMARHFQTRQISVRIFLCVKPEKFQGDALFQYELARKLEIPMISLYDVPTDAASAVSSVSAESIMPSDAARNLSSGCSEVFRRLDAVWDSVSGPRQSVYFVDAMLGTGASGTPRFPMNAVIPWLNLRRERFHTPLLAVDVPSGLDADTGRGFSEDENLTVHASVTLSMAVFKRGLLEENAKKFVGTLYLADIGVSVEKLK